MKRIILCILFLLAVVWGWNAAGKCVALENLVVEETTTVDNEVVQKFDEAINVLMEANHFTNISAQPTFNFTSSLARRYRPAGFTFDKFMEYQLGEQGSSFDNHLKTFFSVSQECAAKQKQAGYFIYSLRRIII